MRKILELGPKQFLSGIAPSAQLQNKGLFLSALGVSPFGSIFLGNTTVGLLQNGPAPTDLTSDTILTWTGNGTFAFAEKGKNTLTLLGVGT